MNKKGFTLVELLAVIVILGFLTSVVTVSVLSSKKKANLEEAKMIEKEIASFGADVYMQKPEPGKYGMTYLEDFGLSIAYEKNEEDNTSEVLGIKSPTGKSYCSAYLHITDDIEFKGYIKCPGLYTTSGYDDTGIIEKTTESED